MNSYQHIISSLQNNKNILFKFDIINKKFSINSMREVFSSIDEVESGASIDFISLSFINNDLEKAESILKIDLYDNNCLNKISKTLLFYKLENNNDNQQYKDSESATFSKNFILIDFQNNKIFKCLACKYIIDVANNLNFNDLLDVSNFMNKTTCSSCFLITDYYYLSFFKNVLKLKQKLQTELYSYNKQHIEQLNELYKLQIFDLSKHNIVPYPTCLYIIENYNYFYMNNQFKFIYGINPNFEKFGKTSDFVIFCWDFESFIDINLVIPQNIIDDIHNIHFYIEELYIKKQPNISKYWKTYVSLFSNI